MPFGRNGVADYASSLPSGVGCLPDSVSESFVAETNDSGPGTTPAEKLVHYAYIDALRGIAFLAVFFFHIAFSSPGLPKLLADIFGRGFAGVQLFYVVSAFTLCASFASRPGDEASIGAYVIRRIARIVPMFWCAIILYLLVSGMGPRWGVPEGLQVRHILLAFFLLHGFDVHALNGVVPGGWSVAVEAQFYVVLPLMYRWASTLRRAVLLWGGATALSVVSMPVLEFLLARHYPAGQHELVHQFAFYSLPSQLPVFCCGLIAFRLLGPDRRYLERIERWLPAKPFQRAVVVIAFGLLLGFPVCPTAWPLGLIHGVPGYLGYGPIFALLLYAVATARLRIIDNPATRFLGKISYSGYLLHFAVLRFVGAYVEPAGSPLLYFVFLGFGGLVLTVILATMTHEWIEKPGIALGRKLTRRTTIDRPDIVPLSPTAYA